MAIKEVLELVIKGDAKGAIEAFRGTEKAADGAEQSVGRMGGLFDKITTKFPIAGKAAERFGIDAGNAGTVAGAAAAGAATAIGAFAVQSVAAYQNLAGEILNFQRISGTTAEQASAFVEVAGDYGVNADQAAGSIGKFAKAIETTPAAFEKYGVDVVRSKDGTVDLNATLVNAADAFARTEDPAKRAALGTALFGKSWQDMVPLLEKGSEGLKQAFEDVASTKILSQEDLEQAEEFRLAMDDLKDAGEGLMIQVGKGLVPVISDLAKEFGSVTEHAEKLTKPVGGLSTLFGGLVRGAKEGNIAVGVFNNTVEKGAEKAKAAEEAERKLADELRYAGSEADKYVQSLLARNAAGEAEKVAAEEAEEAEKALREEFKRQEEATRRLEAAHKDQAAATRDAYKAAQESVSPILAERSANRELEKAAKDVAEKTRDAAKAKFEDADKNDEVVAAQDGLIGKLTDVAGAYVTAKGKALDSAEGSKLYVDKLVELRGKYGEQLGPAIAIYDELIARIRETNRLQQIANQTAAGYNVGGGGDRSAPGAGPVMFSTGSNVSPGDFGGGGFGGQTVNLTVKLDAPITTQQAATWVADQLAVFIRTNGTGWLTSLGVQTR